jgi:hypothetical protein
MVAPFCRERSTMRPLFTKADASSDDQSDFEFFTGRWNVAHRRLRRRLQNDTQWEEFGGVCENRPIIGGLGNIDDNIIDLPGGTYRAATLRLFAPQTRRWSIWWVDGRDVQLGYPMQGGFENGVGTFFGDEMLNGAPIRVRFIWSEITANTAQWQQAFSGDGGANWETNWIMRFTRAD